MVLSLCKFDEKKDMERIAIIPAHPDDLVACLGLCLRAKGVFDVHVIDFTHGERGCGAAAFADGSAKTTRTAEEESVCAAVGATLHWLDEIDGEAYACRNTCERLAAILAELEPRAVFAHWPVDIHGDHSMAGVAALKAVFLAGLSPEIYFFEEAYQTKRFTPDVFLDISDVAERKREIIRLYKCQYKDGGIERHQVVSNQARALQSMLFHGEAEGFLSFVQPMQGQAKTIFQELSAPELATRIRFQGARP